MTGPTGGQLASTVDGPFARGQFVTAEVQFTPVDEGLHRVQVDFSGGLGRGLNEVFAVRPTILGARLSTIGANVECLREDATSQGAWVCFEANSRLVSFWREGRRLQAIPARDFEVFDDVVWVFRPGELERFVDRGGDLLVREPDVILRPSAVDQLAPYGRDGLLSITADAIVGWTVANGQLLGSAPLTLPRGLCPLSAHLSPRSEFVTTFTCGSRPGFVRQCLLDLRAPAEVRCSEQGGTLVGTSPLGMWMAREGGVVSFVPADDAPVLTRTLTSAFVVASSHRLAGAFGPVVAGPSDTTFLLETQPSSISLSLVPEGISLLAVGRDRALFGGASSRFITRRSP